MNSVPSSLIELDTAIGSLRNSNTCSVAVYCSIFEALVGLSRSTPFDRAVFTNIEHTEEVFVLATRNLCQLLNRFTIAYAAASKEDVLRKRSYIAHNNFWNLNNVGIDVTSVGIGDMSTQTHVYRHDNT